jgi:hypothetical protein
MNLSQHIIPLRYRMSYAQWNPATTYVQNDIVSYQGSLFVSLQTPNLNQDPSTATAYWAVQGGGGGVSKITAGTGISITPTGGIGNVTINATGGGSKQWYNIYNAPQTTILTNGLSLLHIVPSWPSNDIVQVLVVATFTSLGQASPLGNDPFIIVDNFPSPGPVSLTVNTGRDWLATYLTPPSGSIPTIFTYNFMVPAGNATSAIAISALTQSIVGTAGWSIYLFY